MTTPWNTSPELWQELKPLVRQQRSKPTLAEAQLWEALRGGRFDAVRFRRQHAIGQCVVDFYCALARLVIEVDGPIHEESREQDAIRDAELGALGFRVLRFTNDQVMVELESVLKTISEALDDAEREAPSGSPLRVRRGAGGEVPHV